MTIKLKFDDLKKLIFEGGYIALLIVYLTRLFLNTTDWHLGFSHRNYFIFAMMAAFCVALKAIFYDKWNLRDGAIAAGVLAICALVYKETGYNDVLDVAILVIGCKGISAKTIVRIYFYVNTFLLLITMLAAAVGMVPDLIHYKNDGIRHSFGSVYPTDFAAHIFYLMAAFCYIKGDKLRYYNLGAFLVIDYILYKYCHTETSVICILGLTLVMVIYKLIRDHGDKVINKELDIWGYAVGILSIPAMAFFSIWATFNYKENEFMTLLASKLSSMRVRFDLAQQAASTYGLNTFGKYFELIGGGGNEGSNGVYNFVDNSFMYILLRYGYIFLIAAIAIFMFMAFRANRKGQFIISIVIAAATVHSFMEHHLMEASYMFVPMLLLSDMDKDYELPLDATVRLKGLGYHIASVTAITVTAAALGYAAVFDGPSGRYTYVFGITALILIIAYMLFIKGSLGRAALISAVVFAALSLYVNHGFAAAEGAVELFRLDEDPMHKLSFVVTMALCFGIPFLGAFFANIDMKKLSAAAVIAGFILVTAFTWNKATEMQEELTNTTQPVIDHIRSLRASYPDRNIAFYADEDTFILNLKTGEIIKQHQPERSIPDIMYYVEKGAQKVNLVKNGQFVYKDLNEDFGYFTNIAELKQ